jgi:adenylate kinase
LQEHFHIPQISTGDILRQAVADGTSLGTEAKKYMNRGELVPDQLIIDIVDERLAAEDARQGFVLDGFPRTVPQAEAFEQMLKTENLALDAVIDLVVPRDELLARLTGRRTCKHCGHMFHLKFNPPTKDGICDECGGDLYQRPDDRKETVGARMDVYERQTEPLRAYFRGKGLLHAVDGARSTDDVFAQILRQVKSAA